MHNKETCEWWDEDGVWVSSCGAAFHFEDGGPKDNDFNFCYKCGKPLRVEAEQGEKGGDE